MVIFELYVVQLQLHHLSRVETVPVFHYYEYSIEFTSLMTQSTCSHQILEVLVTKASCICDEPVQYISNILAHHKRSYWIVMGNTRCGRYTRGWPVWLMMFGCTR